MFNPEPGTWNSEPEARQRRAYGRVGEGEKNLRNGEEGKRGKVVSVYRGVGVSGKKLTVDYPKLFLIPYDNIVFKFRHLVSIA